MSEETRVKSEKLRDPTIFVGGLDRSVNETILLNYFKQFGKPIDHVYIPTNRYSNKHRNYGFVCFTNLEDAQSLIDGHHTLTQLNGKSIFISKARTKAKIFISNLESNVTEEMLNISFSKFGQMIEEPLVFRDVITGKSKNCAVITYERYESADKAIAEMNDSYLENRRIIVKYSQKIGSKTERYGANSDRLNATQTFFRTPHPRDAAFMQSGYQQPFSLNNRTLYDYAVVHLDQNESDQDKYQTPQQPNQSDQNDQSLQQQNQSDESSDDSSQNEDHLLQQLDGLNSNQDLETPYQDRFMQHQNLSMHNQEHSELNMNQWMQHPNCNMATPFSQHSFSDSSPLLNDSTTQQYQQSYPSLCFYNCQVTMLFQEIANSLLPLSKMPPALDDLVIHQHSDVSSSSRDSGFVD